MPNDWFDNHPKEEDNPYWIKAEFCELRGGECTCRENQKADYRAMGLLVFPRFLCMGHVVIDDMLKTTPIFSKLPRRR